MIFVDVLFPRFLLFENLFSILLSSSFLWRPEVLSIKVRLNCLICCLSMFSLLVGRVLSSFFQPLLKVIADVSKIRYGFPGIAFMTVIFPFDEVVRLVYIS